jgi:hypothetical protein
MIAKQLLRTVHDDPTHPRAYAGLIDTELAAARSGPKTALAQFAARALEGVESGLNHVLADERARQIYNAARRDPEQLERTQQEVWDQRKH